MNAHQIALEAIARTNDVAPFVSREIREKLAIAEAAIIIYGFDDSIDGDRVKYRLGSSIEHIREFLAA